MAGLPEDFDSARVIEERWKKDGLQVFKPKYNVLLSYPDDVNVNRYSQILVLALTPFFLLFRATLKRSDGSVILQTNGTETVYDPSQAKTVNPFLAYTPNGTSFSVSD